MTTLLEFFVPGKPASTQTGSLKPRSIRTKAGVRKTMLYPERRNLGWIDEFVLGAKRFRPRTLLGGPLEAELFFVIAPPAKPRGVLPVVPIGDPNPDNFGKGLADAMEGEFYLNDALCSDMAFRKRWVGWRGLPEGVLVRLSRVEAADVA